MYNDDAPFEAFVWLITPGAATIECSCDGIIHECLNPHSLTVYPSSNPAPRCPSQCGLAQTHLFSGGSKRNAPGVRHPNKFSFQSISSGNWKIYWVGDPSGGGGIGSVPAVGMVPISNFPYPRSPCRSIRVCLHWTKAKYIHIGLASPYAGEGVGSAPCYRCGNWLATVDTHRHPQGQPVVPLGFAYTELKRILKWLHQQTCEGAQTDD